MPKKKENKVSTPNQEPQIVILNDKDIKTEYYEDIIRKSRYLARTVFPYYTCSLMAITFKFTFAAVDNGGNPTFAVDKHFRCYINPLIVDHWLKEAQEISASKPCPTCGKHQHNKYAYIAGVILHEMAHPMQKHFLRAQKYHGPEFDAAIFGVSVDCELNDNLLESIKFCNTDNVCLPAGACFPSVWEMPDNLFWEEYYDLLLKKFSPNQSNKKGKGKPLPEGGRCGSGADGKKRPWEDPGEGECDGFEGVSEAELDTINRKVAQDMKEHASKNPGSIPAGMLRWADEVIGEPKYDWRQELNKMIRYCTSKYTAGHKITTYSKRSIVSTVLYDKVILPTYKKPVPRVTLIFDVSGSMDNKAIKDSVAEGEAVLRLIKAESSIISCDTEAHIGKGKTMKKAQLIGGGGTMLNVATEKALQQRHRPNLIVLFTDGYDAFSMERPKNCEIIVCLCGDNVSSEHIPTWMKVIRITP